MLADRQDTAASEHRAMEFQRLDAVQSGLWDRAIDGDVEAATAALRIIQQRCRLLRLEQPSYSWATRNPVHLVPPEFVEQYTPLVEAISQMVVQELLEGEQADFLGGRGRYERREGGGVGWRKGYAPGRLRTGPASAGDDRLGVRVEEQTV